MYFNLLTYGAYLFGMPHYVIRSDVVLKIIKKELTVFSSLELKACLDIVCVNHAFISKSNSNLLNYDKELSACCKLIYGSKSTAKANMPSYVNRQLSKFISYSDDKLSVLLNDVKAFYLENYTNGVTVDDVFISETVFNKALSFIRSDINLLIQKISVTSSTIATEAVKTTYFKSIIHNYMKKKNALAYLQSNLHGFQSYITERYDKIYINTNKNNYYSLFAILYRQFTQFQASEMEGKTTYQDDNFVTGVLDVVTSSGVIATEVRTASEEKDTTIEDESLINLFNLTRQIDSTVFTKLNTTSTGLPFYSILEWYAMKSLLNKLNNDDLNNVQFTKDGYYRLTLSRVLDVSMNVDTVGENMELKFNVCIQQLDYIYNNIYKNNKNKTVTSSMLEGLLDIYETHYDKRSTRLIQLNNLIFDKSMCVRRDSNYTVFGINSIINEYINNAQNDLIDEPETLILNEAGYERMSMILKLISEFERLDKKLSKVGICLSELLPVYYSNIPCTLIGALHYTSRKFKDANDDCYNYVVSKFNASSNLNDYEIDWSLPDISTFLQNNRKITSVVSRFKDSVSKLLGVGIEYYHYNYNAVMAVVLMCAFPETFSVSPINTNCEFKSNLFRAVDMNKYYNYTDSDSGANYNLFLNSLQPKFVWELEDNNAGIDTNLDLEMPDDLTLLSDILALDSIPDLDTPDMTHSVRLDLRKEFFINVDTDVISIICMLLLLSDAELDSYSKSDYSNEFIGITSGKSRHTNKVPIGSRNNGNYKKVYSSGKYFYDNRLDVIGLIRAFFELLIKEIQDEYAKYSSLGFAVQGLEDSLTNFITMFIHNSSMSISALMEMPYHSLHVKLRSMLSNTTSNTNNLFPLVFTDYRTAIIEGKTYDIKYFKNDEGILSIGLFTEDLNNLVVSIKVPNDSFTYYDEYGNPSTTCEPIVQYSDLKNKVFFDDVIASSADNGIFSYIQEHYQIIYNLICKFFIERKTSMFSTVQKPVIIHTEMLFNTLIKLLLNNREGCYRLEYDTEVYENNRIVKTMCDKFVSTVITGDEGFTLTNYYWYSNSCIQGYTKTDNGITYNGYVPQSLLTKEEQESLVNVDDCINRENYGEVTNVYRLDAYYPIVSMFAYMNCCKQLITSFEDIHKTTYTLLKLDSENSNNSGYNDYLKSIVSGMYMYEIPDSTNKLSLLQQAVTMIDIDINSISLQHKKFDDYFLTLDGIVFDKLPNLFNLVLQSDTADIKQKYLLGHILPVRTEEITSMSVIQLLREQYDFYMQYFKSRAIITSNNLPPIGLLGDNGYVSTLTDYVDLTLNKQVFAVDDYSEESIDAKAVLLYKNHIKELNSYLLETNPAMELLYHTMSMQEHERLLASYKFYSNHNYHILENKLVCHGVNVKENEIPIYKDFSSDDEIAVGYLNIYGFWVIIHQDMSEELGVRFEHIVSFN